MSPMIYLSLALLVALPVQYGVMKLKQIRAVSSAIEEGKRIGAGSVAAKTTAKATETVNAVEAGEREAERSPADKAKLQELCNRSASCRDRKRGGV